MSAPRSDATRSELNYYITRSTKYKVFTAEEEKAAFTKLTDVLSRQKLNPEEVSIKKEVTLLTQKIACANLGLVIAIAKKYNFRDNISDLIAQGNLALLEAIPHFDVSKGYKFSTFGSSCIRHRILAYMRHNHSIVHFPNNDRLEKIFFHASRDIAEGERKNVHVTTEMLAKKYDCGVEETEEMLNFLSINKGLVALDAQIPSFGDENHTQADVIPDNTLNTESNIDGSDLCNQLEKRFLPRLSPVEKDILLNRIMSEDPDNLDTIGRRHSSRWGKSAFLSKERIRQIESKVKVALMNYTQRIMA